MPLESSISSVSRRQMLRLAVAQSTILPAAASILTSNAMAVDDFRPLNRYPRMVQNYFVEQVREAERRGDHERAKLKTRDDALRYVQTVRTKIRQCFGPEPKRTPLNPRITKVLERDGYNIENLIFDSRPNFPVTANLYLPTRKKGPYPGVVGTCGHSRNGKASEAYQSFAQGLAKQGYICLLYDPIGQGERLQYVDKNLKSPVGVGVREHLYAGNQQFLVGEFFGAWRAWDGVRALDYLLTRGDVDKQHLGVTGNSGGGTMTTWLCGVEQRWTMAAPSCFVTTFLHNMENELPADTEQCPPRALALGLDHSDFLAALAPDPVVILAKERDFFDARGSEEAYERLANLYRLLRAEDKIRLFIGPTTHGYSQENREAMYQSFNHATGILTAAAEPAITIEDDETLQCTSNGQVAELDGTRSIFSFTRAASRLMASKRPALAGESLQAAIKNVLKLPKSPDTPPNYRIWRYLTSRNYPAPAAIAYGVETEPGIQAIVYRLTAERWHSRPTKGTGPAILYVSDLSSDEELRNEPLIRETIDATPNVPFYTCDVRGSGESQPDTCGPNSFLSPYGSDYMYAIHSLMLDRPYVGQKTFDVLRVIDWLAAVGHKSIHIIGKGRGAFPATFAAVLSSHVSQVTLKNALMSYASMAESEQYDWPLSTMVPDILSRFDLPDCYRSLSAKQLRQIDPAGPVRS
jgi:dienelactone hydrolase